MEKTLTVLMIRSFASLALLKILDTKILNAKTVTAMKAALAAYKKKYPIKTNNAR